MSSSSASNTRLSLVLAPVTSSDSGSPPPSTARCSLDPRLARSTGFAPHRSPPDRPQADRIHADPRPVQPAGLAQFVQQQLLEPLEHPSGRPLGEPPPAGGHAAAAELAHRQQRPRRGGAGHEDDRGHAGPVGHGTGRATAGVGGWGGSRGWMRCHSASGSSRSARVVMGGDHRITKPTPPAAAPEVPKCPLNGPDGSLSATSTSVDHRQMDGTTITIPIAQVNSVNMAYNG